MAKDDRDVELALSAVQDAADALIVAAVALGGVHVAEPPEDALDLALRASKPHQAARVALDAMLDRVRRSLPADQLILVLEVEEAANAVVSTATDVGFALGAALRTGRPAR